MTDEHEPELNGAINGSGQPCASHVPEYHVLWPRTRPIIGLALETGNIGLQNQPEG